MNKEVFISNRKRLMERVEDNSLVILFAGNAPKKSADEAYPFTPNRNFYYLTGIDEEEHIITLRKKDNKVEEVLFIKKPDLEKEKWLGKTIRKNEAIEISGVDEVKYLEEFLPFVHSSIITNGITNIWLDLERDSFNEDATYTEKFAKKLMRKYPYVNIKCIYNYIAELRLVKSEEEVKEIRKAIRVTIDGVEMLMKHAKPGIKEYELEAYFDFVCKKEGAKDYAIKTIAAAGKNAAVLHYVANNSEINDGDLILFDLGAQVNYYNGDISRTIPANGKFEGRKKDVYNAVLRVNEKIIDAIKPGANWGKINEMANDLLAEEMIGLGLIKDKKDYRKYYWHSIGHSLGLDCHDVGPRWVDLKPGMIFTVEPGLYIEEEGIGVRIEDDVLVTEDGNEVLTKEMIKSVEEIENFMAK